MREITQVATPLPGPVSPDSNGAEGIGDLLKLGQEPQQGTTQAQLIEELLAIGTALSGIQDLEDLLTLILQKCREITCSDAGSVYLLDHSDEIPKLLFKVTQNASLPHHSFSEFAMPLSPKA